MKLFVVILSFPGVRTQAGLITSSRDTSAADRPMLSDLRLAFRNLARSRVFAAIAILTLAVGIGGATAMFSALQALVLTPFRYNEPDRLVMVWSGEGWPLSAPDFLDLHEQATAFSSFGVYSPRTANIGSEKPEAVTSVLCSDGLLPAFGVQPARGRWLEHADTEKGAAPVVVISYGLWQRTFGGEPDLVGRAVRLNGADVTVVGIMPASFELAGPWLRTQSVDVILPLALEDETHRDNHWLCGVARLRDGVTEGSADAEIKAIGVKLTKLYPDSNSGKHFLIRSLRFEMTKDVGSRVWMLFGAVSLVLLVACANVASMLLARNSQRQAEFGVRIALGATRGAIVRLALAESTALAAIGTATGVALACGGIKVLQIITPASEARRAAMTLDGRVLLFALGAAALVALLAGLPPALAAVRMSIASIIRGGGRGAIGSRTSHHLLRGLIITQVAVAFILANVAALFSASYLKLIEENNHLASDSVLSAALNLNGERYGKDDDKFRFWKQLVERIEPLPGVSSVGITSKLPLEGGSNTNALVNDEIYDPTQPRIQVERSSITPGYFQAMGLALLKGRGLRPEDADGDITGVVVNRRMVEKAWPGKDPIGELMRGNNPGKPWYQSRVVGVVEDVRQWGAEQEVQAEMYCVPKNLWGDQLFLIVRSTVPATQLIPQVRHEVAILDSELPLTRIRTMSDVVREATKGNRATAGLVDFFMAVALGLVAVGLYGTLSYHVLQRTREIGVRMAMGALKRDIIGLVFVQGSRWVLVGVTLGIAGTLALSSVLHAIVYGMDRWSIVPLVMATIAVGAAALAACWLPAQKAASMDPLAALRSE